VEILELNKTVDFTDYDQYDIYHDKLTQILRESKDEILDTPPIDMIATVRERQMKRKEENNIIPTPFRQINNLTNAGGFARNSLVVYLDKPKGRKTFTLINTARGYMKREKNVLYIDTENGADQIMDRMIQSTLCKTKRELISGEYDEIERKHMIKYKKIKGNFFVKQVPALSTTVSDVRNIIQNFERDSGKKIHIVMIDYAGKLGTSNQYTNREDFDRIQRVYVDLENLAKECDLDCIWTAQHTTRDSAKKKASRYSEEDIAGCISIVRNATAVIGINSTEEEERGGFQRLEIVVQRDGLPYGRALMRMDLEKQRMVEVTPEQEETYNAKYPDKLLDYGEDHNSYYDSYNKRHQPVRRGKFGGRRKKKKFVSPAYNPEKYKHKTGDLPRGFDN
jgi:KaiC/GvpD/RAD55 family RecA-like ATPase